MFCNYIIKTPIFFNKISLCLIFMLCLGYYGFWSLWLLSKLWMRRTEAIVSRTTGNTHGSLESEFGRWHKRCQATVINYQVHTKPSEVDILLKENGKSKCGWHMSVKHRTLGRSRSAQLETYKRAGTERRWHDSSAKTDGTTRLPPHSLWHSRLGLALAVPIRKSASDGTDTTGLSFCFFKLDLFILFVSVLPTWMYVHHMCS